MKNSIESYKKSIAGFEADESKPLWMKIEAMTWLGQVYHYSKDYQKAAEIYNAVLEIAPDHQWVTNLLLPATLDELEDK